MYPTGKMIVVGIASLTIGLLLAMVLPFFALEDPGKAGTAWASTICGGFLLATLGALLLLTGVFRVQSARRIAGLPQVAPPKDEACPHRTSTTSRSTTCASCHDPPGVDPPGESNTRSPGQEAS